MKDNKSFDFSSLIARLSDKDEPVFTHGKRVARFACAVARIMKYPGVEVKIIHNASVVHDIGKLGLPAEIINKPGVLSEEEIVVIRKHPGLGYSLLTQIIRSESIIAQVALQHHERLNGSGYPFGLRGDEIIPIARIITVADVVDTMVSPQVYRPALTMDEAAGEIKQNSGLLYDSRVVAASLLFIGKGKFSV
ncbi:MAG: HD domain-containing protein [Candidatus Omnitrophica bacterium]|nr:HD domain-containing protein [Candidatus Omnitrophota bacterium]MDD5027422.1 HD domain-containing protein [Candidatus Omnitrophota bacterium]MDD5506568.1 HD domain-containing protein [Candidatus Omnitrophota bacterium]